MGELSLCCSIQVVITRVKDGYDDAAAVVRGIVLQEPAGKPHNRGARTGQATRRRRRKDAAFNPQPAQAGLARAPLSRRHSGRGGWAWLAQGVLRPPSSAKAMAADGREGADYRRPAGAPGACHNPCCSAAYLRAPISSLGMAPANSPSDNAPAGPPAAGMLARGAAAPAAPAGVPPCPAPRCRR
jgi:hypothetical protein